MNRIKIGLANFGLKFLSIDEKIVRMLLETSLSNVNEIVILPAIKLVMKKIVNKLKDKRVKGRVYNGLLNGVKVSVIRSLVGAPNAAMTMECLKRCNSKIIIRLDFCGGIGSDNNPINIGDILIPKSAACGDGTTPYYFLKYPELLKDKAIYDNPISEIHKLNIGNPKVYLTKPYDNLKELFLNQGKQLYPNKVKEVDLWTTDAMFCETDDLVKGLSSINIQAIDMESSIIFLLGELYKLQTASILSVSDLPGHDKYDLFKTNILHPDMEKGIDDAIKILIQTLPRIKPI
jgi:nucleoside phosphorylase